VSDPLPSPPPADAKPWLVFSDGPFDKESAAHDLSALAFAGDTLWTAGDERAAVERFVRQPDGSFAGHAHHPLGRLLDLPEGGPDAEMDIEGVDVEDGWLWVVGSHSLRRRKPDPEKERDPAELIRRLAAIDRQPNRYTLARLPLVPDPIGRPTLPEGGDAPDGREPSALRLTNKGSRLSKLLAKDEHLAPFVGVPAKENGLDIEGLAVRRGRVFLGLRGPVLRGYAVVLELRPEPRRRKLRLAPFPDDGRRYRKHFLDLHGLGIRDLALDGDDLLLLAGPTLAHDGRHAVFRWRGAAGVDCPTLTRREELEHVLELPTVPDRDRAEGMALRHGPGGAKELLVLYDSPSEARLDRRRGAVLADLFRLG
jgi:Protein of unknown function (DUF3616)